MTESVTERSVLHICTTCKAGTAQEPRPGQLLYDALAALISGEVELRPVACLASCDNGCAASIFAPSKNFGYILGGLSAAIAPDILAYACSYAASATGAVMPSKRAPSLANAILSRFPAYGLKDNS